jgi:hypothetical protein
MRQMGKRLPNPNPNPNLNPTPKRMKEGWRDRRPPPNLPLYGEALQTSLNKQIKRRLDKYPVAFVDTLPPKQYSIKKVITLNDY